MNSKRAYLAYLELIVAGASWGFGFIATVWLLEGMSPFFLIPARFAAATLLSLPFILLKSSLRKEFFSWRALKVGLWPGVFFGVALFFQCWGQKYTSASNSGFITCLYVIFVPIIEVLFTRHQLPRRHFLYVAGALIGTAMMVELNLHSPIHFGDFLTFICAILFSFQIYFIGISSHSLKSAFVFNVWQTLWAAVCAIILASIMGWSLPHFYTAKIIWSFAFLVVIATLLAFMLQIRAQKILSSSQSSIFFLLESPFAALFAVIFLNESFTLLRLLGGLLILVSCFAASGFRGANNSGKR